MQAVLLSEDVNAIQQMKGEGGKPLLQWSKLYAREYEKLMASQIQKYLRNMYESEQLGKFGLEVKKQVDLSVVCKKKSQAVKHNNQYVFITVNPPPTVGLSQFMGTVEAYVKRNIITNYCYVFEQRSTDINEVKGMHAHILVERNVEYKPSKFTLNTQNTFKRIIKDPKNSNHLNIQFVGVDFAKDKQSYILEEKTGESDGIKKSDKQKVDIEWRKKESIETYYGNKIFP